MIEHAGIAGRKLWSGRSRERKTVRAATGRIRPASSRPSRLLPWAVLLLALAGCAAAGPSRISLDRYSTAYPGLTVANFSQEEAEAFVRYFATEKGYEIKFADSDDARVRSELDRGDSSLLWIAEKPGSPAILLVSADDRLTVTFLPDPGIPRRAVTGEDAAVLYNILKGRFGAESVHLGDTGGS